MNPFSIKAAGDQAEIMLYGAIGGSFFEEGVTAKEFADTLKAAGAFKEILLRINSGGGDVFDGAAIYSLLRDHPASVTVQIDGLAASAASLVAMAGDTINISAAGFLMIHNPWGMSIGDHREMLKMADTLETIRQTFVNTYAARSKKSKAQIGNLMDEETWFTADESVKNGFADAVTPPIKAMASCDLSKLMAHFHKIPNALVGAPLAAPEERVRHGEPLQEAEPALSPYGAGPATVPVSVLRRKLELSSR